jgi:hypothetical protein
VLTLNRAPRTFRIAVIALAILATLGVSMASESAAHFHAKPPASGCDICFTAHLSSGPAGSAQPVLNAPQLRWQFTPGTAFAGYRFLQSSTSLTRGPPSSSL